MLRQSILKKAFYRPTHPARPTMTSLHPVLLEAHQGRKREGGAEQPLQENYKEEKDDRMNTAPIISKVWSFCTTLRDDGVSYGDYLEQLTYLIFLKMADEYAKPTA